MFVLSRSIGSTLDFLRAEHGYSALVDVYQGGRMHRVLYDAGVSPFGLVWSRRRIASPDRFVDLPTPSRAGIEDAGFALIEDRQPSFLFELKAAPETNVS